MADLFDLDAERAVLGAVMIEPERFDDAAKIISGGDFHRLAHAYVWEAMEDLRRASRPIDYLTVKTLLEDTKRIEEVQVLYLASLVDGVPKATNITAYAGIVAVRARDRRAVEIMDRARKALMAGDDNAVELMAAVAKATTAPSARPDRRVRLVKASAIPMRPVRWLWPDLMALGSLGLLGGREGIGKSMLEADVTAKITTGRLPGEYYGTPRDVVLVTTEDSKAHTIVPRLVAAGADLDRVHFVVVETAAGHEADLVLPLDVPELERVIRDVSAVLVWFDPLLSRLDAQLDSHKDAEVRRALEPLAKLAESTGACFVGLIHVNKSSTSDPLTMLMASRAFSAVARFVLFAMVDPDDERRRLLGLAKSNLGRTDVPTLAYQVVPHHVATTAEGEVWTGRLEWLGEAGHTIREALQNTTATGDRTATSEAAEWLVDYLHAAGGAADSAEIKRAAQKAGHSADHLRRARERLKLRAISTGFPRTTKWMVPAQSGQGAPTSLTTATTATTGDISNKLIDCHSGPVGAVGAVKGAPTTVATTGRTTGDADAVRL